MEIVVCASMAFAKQMIAAKGILKQRGHKVILPTEVHTWARGVPIDNAAEKIEFDA